MKTCSKCGEYKELNEFHNRKSSPDGKRNQCKICRKDYNKEYRENNKEKISLNKKEWRNNNKEKVTTYKKQWYNSNKEKTSLNKKEWRNNNKEKVATYKKQYREDNKEYVAIKQKEWRENNTGKSNAIKAKYRAAKLRAIPKWTNLKRIELNFYAKARELKLTVDHIVPLQHPLVCGLHCEDNLQLLTLSENSAKCNNFKDEDEKPKGITINLTPKKVVEEEE